MKHVCKNKCDGSLYNMKTAPTLDKIIAFLKIDLLFACCWPLPRTATKGQIIRDRIFRYLSIVNGAFIIVELLYSINNHLDNVFLIMQLACALGIFCEVPLQIYLFMQQHDRLQVRKIIIIFMLYTT